MQSNCIYIHYIHVLLALEASSTSNSRQLYQSSESNDIIWQATAHFLTDPLYHIVGYLEYVYIYIHTLLYTSLYYIYIYILSINIPLHKPINSPWNILIIYPLQPHYIPIFGCLYFVKRWRFHHWSALRCLRHRGWSLPGCCLTLGRLRWRICIYRIFHKTPTLDFWLIKKI